VGFIYTERNIFNGETVMKRATALLLAGLFSTLPTLAQAGAWSVDTRNNCKIWNADPHPGETVSWSGACYNGMGVGPGQVQWSINGKPNGKYIGSLLEGRKHGKGKIILPNGSVEEHTFVLGEKTPHMFW
jgi:hypothetical protein